MKQLRQRAIRDLVDQRPIRTQQELATALRERGFRTTQATISRDVAELGLIKISREGTAAYALPPRLIEAETSGEDRLRKLLSDLPLEIHEAGLLLVLRTLPGSAHAIAAALDREMLGALGADVGKLYTGMFALGSFLAGLGGALVTPIKSILPGMDVEIIVEAFIVVVIGGLGSLWGTFLGALIFGQVLAFGILIFPRFSMFSAFALMAVILIVRPWGLLGRPLRQ